MTTPCVRKAGSTSSVRHFAWAATSSRTAPAIRWSWSAGGVLSPPELVAMFARTFWCSPPTRTM
jgi:hypothetical protein